MSDEPSADKRADRLQQEIESLRDDLGGLVTELDHRRHDAFNVRRQFRRHALPLALCGLTLVGVAVGGVLSAMRRARSRARLPARAASVGHAVARFVKHPERQAPPPPTLGFKVLAAAGAGIASVLAKRFAERLVDTTRPRVPATNTLVRNRV